jgi:hypothetical protein
MTDIVNCDVNILEEINLSEEFKRGLLILVKVNYDSIQNIIPEIFKIQKGIHPLLKDTVVLCEDDGTTLLLYNSFLTKEFLESIL